MSESSVVEKQLQRVTWRKRFRRKAKKASKRLGKMIAYPFMCVGSCSKRGEEDSTDPAVPEQSQSSVPPTFASMGAQTSTPNIIDILCHGGETMKHRPAFGIDMCMSISIASQSQSDISTPMPSHHSSDDTAEKAASICEHSKPERASRPTECKGPPCIRRSASHGIVRNNCHLFPNVPRRSESVPPSFPRKQSVTPENLKVAFKATFSGSISNATCLPDASNANTLSSLPSQKLAITSILSSAIPLVAKPGVSSIQVDLGVDSVTAMTPDSSPSANQSTSSDSNTIAVAQEQMARPVAVEAATKSADMNAGHKLTLRGKISSLFRIITRGKRVNSQPINIDRATQLGLDKVESAYLNGGIKGFYNLGNTCFMNSIIQCLSHTLELTDIFLLGDFPEGTVCSEYKRAMKKIWLPNRRRGWGSFKWDPPYSIIFSPRPAEEYRGERERWKNVSLKSLKEVISCYCKQYDGNKQHDAPEFFSNLIGLIHEELTPVTSREVEEIFPVGISDLELATNRWECYFAKEGSPIADIFVGQLKSTILCTICGYASVSFEPFWDISLPICSADGESAHLADCFSDFCRDEFLVGENQPTCMSCAKRQPSGKKLTIQRFPPVLVLSLKRFLDGKNKLEMEVTIPQHMELAEYASLETLESTGCTAIGYDLFAVSNHIGSMNSGHYTADVKHFASEQWFHCNDNTISTSKQLILSQPEFSSAEAYMLFYRRSD